MSEWPLECCNRLHKVDCERPRFLAHMQLIAQNHQDVPNLNDGDWCTPPTRRASLSKRVLLNHAKNSFPPLPRVKNLVMNRAVYDALNIVFSALGLSVP
jgi:hypothetical protein